MKTPKKILIIDDDRDFAESIQTFLQLHGHDVDWADNSPDGVALAAVRRPDVILCDVMMGERTEGFFTVQQLRRTPGVEGARIFVISSVFASVPAFQVEPDQSWLAHDEFIYKPVDPETLLEKIEAGGAS
ncbi:MAG TPA: response regulator [Longimicrobiales bacterium]